MKVLVGLSGGVDSSVTACLLKEAGHEVIGATMSIWDKSFMKDITFHKDACFSPHEEKDIEAARELCQKLDIPYHVIDCAEEYKKLVLENFKADYMSGRTPNPCVWCNATIKFDALPRSAAAQGIEFDKFATGHYAQVSYNETVGRWQLQRAADLKKDQSYFIYRLKQEQLSRILMPLGGVTKEHVRELARKYGLAVSDKPDSQDFYAGDINDILRAEPKAGHFVNRAGKVLGHHDGIWHFTVGQRKGLGIAAERPLYVLELKPETNEVVVGFEEECYQGELTAHNLTWLSIAKPTEPLDCFIKMRSAQSPIAAQVVVSDDIATVVFHEPQKGVARGQSVVFYDDKGFVLGGGIIESANH